ncbi:MAG: gluconate 2-dehydrogenase subunit 3 family protein [Acidobacteriota bacterium]
MTTFISRRELLRRAGLAGAVAIVTPSLATGDAAAQGTSVAARAGRPLARPPLEHLTPAQADVLDAIVARLIPSDADGPGALEAGATHYIDHALGGALAAFTEAYASGLAALDRYARASRGQGFTGLSGPEQDAALSEIDAGAAPGFPGSAVFFALVRGHTIQGTFCDPYYGGNTGFVGWDLIGYPGVRTIATSDEQRLGANVPANHKSAYDYDMFNKA